MWAKYTARILLGLDKVDVVKERCGSRKVGANKEVELPKQNYRSLKVWSSKIFVEIRESRAKAARKARESWGAQSKALTPRTHV